MGWSLVSPYNLGVMLYAASLHREINIHSFVHLAISIAPLQGLYYSEALPTTARILYRSFTPKRKATLGKGLAQGPYMAARAGVEPTILRLKAIDSTKAPPCPTTMNIELSRSFTTNPV